MRGRNLKLFLSFVLTVLVFTGQELLAVDIVETTHRDRESLSLTIYTDMALVEETRQVRLSGQKGGLLIKDVSSMIIPDSINIEGVNLIEQEYSPGVITRKALLDSFTGRKVKLVIWDRQSMRKKTIDAILLSVSDGYVFSIDGEIYLDPPGSVVLPELPRSFNPEPFIRCLYQFSSGSSGQIRLSYLTQGLGWSATYVVVLKDASSLDIKAWATVKNHSGISFEDARVVLVAGTPAIEKKGSQGYRVRVMAEKAMTVSEPVERAFYEYHIYDFDYKTTLLHGRTKQLRLFDARDVSFEKEYLLSFSSPLFSGPSGKKDIYRAKTYIVFSNTEANNLGRPMPAGIVRVYRKKDTDSTMVFLGESAIEHLPVASTVRLFTGYAFDITAERLQREHRKIGPKEFESEWQVRLNNQKKEPVEVIVQDRIDGLWRVIDSTHPYVRVDASTVRFSIKLAPQAETELRYRVEVRY